MPTRVLGKTGARVSILAFGGGSRFLMYKREESAAALNRALDLGITYLDTAEEYGDGESQTRMGEVLRTRRKEVFLASKLTKRDYDGAMRGMEASLKRLQTDHVDLIHVHGLEDAADLEKVSAKGGVYEALLKIRDQKMARFIGITCHSDPEALRTALERHDFDCTQMALNAGQRGMNRHFHTSFETVALPVAVRKKMGIIAMKVFAQEKLLGQAPPEKLISYALSLPITAAVIGMPTLANLEENIGVAKAFKPLSPEEMRRLSGELSARNKVALDSFFCHHIDA